MEMRRKKEKQKQESYAMKAVAKLRVGSYVNLQCSEFQFEMLAPRLLEAWELSKFEVVISFSKRNSVFQNYSVGTFVGYELD